jgi:hypothetical protein
MLKAGVDSYGVFGFNIEVVFFSKEMALLDLNFSMVSDYGEEF